MSQYGEGDLVNNPRYQGQSGGTDVRGPEGESRYGAMPMSTGTGNAPHDPLEPIRNPAAYGFKRDEPEGFRYPGMPGAGAQQHNLAAPNAHPSQAGYGSLQPGYGQHQDPARDEFAKEQPGYGQPGFGAPTQGQNTGSLWPSPTPPPNAHRSDLVGHGQGAQREGIVDRAKDAVGMGPNSGYENRRDEPGYGTQGYGQPREGMVDRAKDAVGVGPNSGYDNGRDEPGYGTQGYGQPREGMVDRTKDAMGVGPNDNRRNQTGYDNYGNPQREGVVDKMKDAVGIGPNTGRPHGEYNPNVNHPSEERGFGGGLGNPHGYDQSPDLGTGYENRMATGADAYGQPRGEGVVDRMKDDVGVGPNSGYGVQDRVTGVNEPTRLDQSGDMNLPPGQHVPQSVLGERRTEPGYDMSKGHLSDKLGGYHGIEYDERRGKGYEDTAGGYDARTGTDTYDATNTGAETGYDDTDVQHGTGAAPPKKGLMTKIKEKIHHTH